MPNNGNVLIKPVSDETYEDMSIWYDEAGNRHATINLTFAFNLPRTPQTAKAYLELYKKSEWIHLKKLTQAWARALRALARHEKETK